MKTMRDLNKLAASLGCTVTDRVSVSRAILIDAPDGFGWDEGTLLQLFEVYHDSACFKEDIRFNRTQAINDSYTRLLQMGAPDSPAVDQ